MLSNALKTAAATTPLGQAASMAGLLSSDDGDKDDKKDGDKEDGDKEDGDKEDGDKDHKDKDGHKDKSGSSSNDDEFAGKVARRVLRKVEHLIANSNGNRCGCGRGGGSRKKKSKQITRRKRSRKIKRKTILKRARK